MAYALKYQLFFTDVENNKFKIEIHQKDFVLDPFGLGTQPTELIGAANPAQIKWDADDDIYSPIIGSRCLLNFFVTDSNTYEEFYKSGEREFKVKILEYASYGRDWDQELINYDAIDQNWDGAAGAEIFYKPIWEGFLVNDGYKEAVVTTPFQLKLEAIDGLGTLDTFDVPYPSDNSASKEQLFFYLKEILKLTGHEFDMYISNDIRKDGGGANDTIFHDIEISRYIFSNKNLILMNAKESLRHILKMTNSRLFQSFARWYIVNNSSLIDNRITQSTLTSIGSEATSGADVVNEPSEPVATPVYSAPDITLKSTAAGQPMIDGDTYTLLVSNTGSEVVTYTWTKPDSSTFTQNKGDALFSTHFLGAVSTSDDGDTYSVTGTDANGNTDTSSFTLDVDPRPTPPPSGDQNFTLRLNISNSVTNAYISQVRLLRNYTVTQVGDNFTMSFDVTSLTGEFTDASQITTLTTTYGTISKSLQGDFIRITVTGTLPDGGHIGTIVVAGNPATQQFTHTYTANITGLSNASLSPTSESVTAGTGKTYSKTFSLTANSGYKWQGSIGSAGGVTVTSNSAIYDSITTSKTSDTNVNVVVNGTIGISSPNAILTFSGSPIGAAPATSVNTLPPVLLQIAQNAGYVDIFVTADGNYTASIDRRWLTITPDSGISGSFQKMTLRFSANNSASTRSNTVSFFPTGSTTRLQTLIVQQEGTA